MSLRVDPFTTHNFMVIIEGVPVANFMEVSAITAETSVEKIKVGGMNQSEISLLGATKYSDVSMKQGMTSSPVLTQWHNAVVQGYSMRTNIHIIAYDSEKVPRAEWMLLDAVPIKMVTPALKAMATEIAVTEITFTHNGILRIL